MAESYHCRCIFSFLRNVQVVSRMCVLSSVCLFETVACQAILSMGFPRQDYWSGLSFSSSGDRPDPGIEPMSPALQENSLPLSHQGSPYVCVHTSVLFFLHSQNIMFMKFILNFVCSNNSFIHIAV